MAVGAVATGAGVAGAGVEGVAGAIALSTSATGSKVCSASCWAIDSKQETVACQCPRTTSDAASAHCANIAIVLDASCQRTDGASQRDGGIGAVDRRGCSSFG